MLKLNTLLVDQFSRSIFLLLFGYLGSYSLLFAQNNPAAVEISYAKYPSMDGSIVCREPKNRKSCNLDFDNCKRFVTVRDYYILAYGLGGLAGALSGKSDAQRAQDIQNKAAELAQQAKQSGQDLNISAFDEIDGHAKGELGWLYSKQALHVGILAYSGIIFSTWKDDKNAYDTKVCDNFYHPGNDLNGSECISDKLNDKDESSKLHGCRNESVHFKDLNYENETELNQKCFFLNQNNLNINEISQIKLYDEIKSKNPETSATINILNNQSVPFVEFLKEHLSDYIFPFLQSNTERVVYHIEREHSFYPALKLGSCSIKVTACKHLCDVDMNFYNFIISNYEHKKKLQDFILTVQKNMAEINAQIARMQGLRDANNKERQAYLDSLKGQTTGTDDGGNKDPIVMDCAKNPYLSGCVGRYDNGSGRTRNFNRKPVAVPTAESDDDGIGMVEPDKGGGGIQPGSPGGGGGGGSPGGGGDGGGGGAPSAASTGNLDDDKKKGDEEAPPLDLQGVSDYGGKKKKSSSGGGSGNYVSGSNNKKSKNPFEDLFGDKKKGKDDRSGIHLRDIASNNAAEDEENGFSNLFSRITKTYQKKYHQGVVGDKNSTK